MFVRRLKNKNAAALILRLDCGLFGNCAAQCFAQKIAHPLDTARSSNIASHPLHCSCLNNCSVRSVHVNDKLPPMDSHLGAEILGLRI